MKTLIMVAITLLAMGCDNNVHTVKQKWYSECWGLAVPNGICTYTDGTYHTQDSCNKYNIGDTIK